MSASFRARRLEGGAVSGRPLPLVRTALALGLAAIAAAGCGTTSRAPQRASADRSAKPVSRAARPRGEEAAVVATAAASSLAVYRRPAAPRPFLRLRGTTHGTPLVFLVRRRKAGWEQVYLPVRPNEATGWIRDRSVRLALDPFSLEVRLTAHELLLRKGGRLVARYPAGVGRSVLPTPTGRYYIVELMKQPDPGGPYGPYAFGLSAYSNVLYSFGGGPGQIGIHGTDDPRSIGRNFSHGCIRLPNSAITALARKLPLGTPVTIHS